MNWINIRCETLGSEAFLHSSREQIGTWLLLMKYCHEQENKGVIQNARNWPPGTWMRIIGSDTPVELCPLWLWRNDDLVLYAFDRDKQFEVERRRTIAKNARARQLAIKEKKSIDSPIDKAIESRRKEKEKEKEKGTT